MKTSIALTLPTLPTLPTLATLLSLAFTPGCLTVSDDEGPTLSVEIFWDDEPDSSEFQGEDCFGAHVDRMEWALWQGSNETCTTGDAAAGMCRRADSDTDGVKSFWVWAQDDDNCQNALDVIDAPPGTYELDLTGISEDGMPKWKATCSGLTVLRFDVAFECDVPAP